MAPMILPYKHSGQRHICLNGRWPGEPDTTDYILQIAKWPAPKELSKWRGAGGGSTTHND